MASFAASSTCCAPAAMAPPMLLPAASPEAFTASITLLELAAEPLDQRLRRRHRRSGAHLDGALPLDDGGLRQRHSRLAHVDGRFRRRQQALLHRLHRGRELIAAGVLVVERRRLHRVEGVAARAGSPARRCPSPAPPPRAPAPARPSQSPGSRWPPPAPLPPTLAARLRHVVLEPGEPALHALQRRLAPRPPRPSSPRRAPP